MSSEKHLTRSKELDQTSSRTVSSVYSFSSLYQSPHSTINSNKHLGIEPSNDTQEIISGPLALKPAAEDRRGKEEQRGGRSLTTDEDALTPSTLRSVDRIESHSYRAEYTGDVRNPMRQAHPPHQSIIELQPPPDQHPPSPPSPLDPNKISTARALAIIFVCVFSFVVNNSTSLSSNLLIPSIQRELHIEASDLQWVSSGFPLGFGSCLLLSGRLADLFGHKLFIQLGTSFFGLSALGCALSQTHVQISIFRVFQGLGAAATAPSLIGVLGRHLEPNSTLKRIGFASLSAGAPLGGSFGLLAGGFITQGTPLGWRSFFYLCFAAGMFAAILATIIIPADEKTQLAGEKSRVDWLGAILIISGLTLLTFSLGISSKEGWGRVIVLLPFILSIIILTSFVLWQKKLEREPQTVDELVNLDNQHHGLQHLEFKRKIDPILKLDLFKRENYQFSIVLIVVCLLWFGFVIQNFFFHQYLQDYLRLDLVQSVLRFIPMLVVGLLLNILFGFLSHKISAQILMTVGCIGTAVSCLLSALMDPRSSYWRFNFASVALSVVGPDFVFACGTLYGSQISTPSEQAVTGGLFHTFAQMGNAIGLSIATLLQVEITRSRSREFGIIVDDDLNIAPPVAFLAGLKAGFWLCFASLCLAALLSFIFLRNIGILGKPKLMTRSDSSTLSLGKLESNSKSISN